MSKIYVESIKRLLMGYNVDGKLYCSLDQAVDQTVLSYDALFLRGQSGSIRTLKIGRTKRNLSVYLIEDLISFLKDDQDIDFNDKEDLESIVKREQIMEIREQEGLSWVKISKRLKISMRELLKLRRGINE